MKIANKSNCLFGAIIIKRLLGGKLEYRPGWSEPGRGFKGFLNNPWGHWHVRLPDGSTASYSAFDKNLSALQQLWFRGYLRKRTQ